MKKALFLSLLIILMAGCRNGRQQAPETSRRIRITAAQVVTAPGSSGLSYSGTVEASQTIPLNFRTTGTVEQVYVEAGDVVKQGQILAILDDSDLRNIYATMLAKFDQAQDAYDRLKMVHDEGSLPEIKWVEMKTNLDQAKASLDLAKNNLEKCRLIAPLGGIVGRRNIEPGQSSIGPGTAPIELVRIETVLVKVAVPENEIHRIKKGGKASMSVIALEGARYEGEVTNVSPVAELMSRTYTVKISVKNPGLDLKPGMVCDVSLFPEEETPVLIVPYQAVSKDPEGNNFVFVVAPDRKSVKKQVVRTGKYQGTGIIITEGLTEGQSVAISGIEKLSDNSLIEM